MSEGNNLDAMDHVAVAVKDVAKAVEWYTKTFKCEVHYQDETWAFLAFANIKLALVVRSQHPKHVAFIHPEAEKFGKLTQHRDGSRSIYITDPSGNSVEIMDRATK